MRANGLDNAHPRTAHWLGVVTLGQAQLSELLSAGRGRLRSAGGVIPVAGTRDQLAAPARRYDFDLNGAEGPVLLRVSRIVAERVLIADVAGDLRSPATSAISTRSATIRLTRRRTGPSAPFRSKSYRRAGAAS